ncbi:MAG: hypothetical protein U0359_22245 [Byssovorax sp.]
MLDQPALKEHLQRIARDGYTIVEDAFEASLADELLDETPPRRVLGA